jgi:hypothetical protein
MLGTASLSSAFREALVLIRSLQDHEFGVIQPLFETVFKHSVSLDVLRWKYAEQRGESWVFEGADGQPLVHCGLYFRDILFQDARLRVPQLVDLMALPKAQGLTRADSPFAVLLRSILTGMQCSDNPAGLAFGFPSERAMTLAERVKVCRSVDRMMELVFEPTKCSRFGATYRVLSKVSSADASKLNKLWLGMSRSLSDYALGVRDVPYLQQRYLAHPEHSYTLLMVESCWLKTPIGLAVVRPSGDRYELLDVVCDWKDVPEVIGAVQSWLTANAGSALFFLLTERFARQLASWAVRCDPTEFRIMGNLFSLTASLKSLDERWWLTGGDTDYR